tara:strand:+ start:2152 stop:2931 length:780 start_codon:yes stop_codon:yes gene_type:complete
MSTKYINRESKQKKMNRRFLGRNPSKTIHRVAIFLGSIWMTTFLLNFIWPMPDEVSKKIYPLGINLKNISLPSSKSSIIILITNSNKQYLPKARNLNGKDLHQVFILQLSPDGHLSIFNMPINNIVSRRYSYELPTLSNAFQIGGVSLVSDIVSESIILEKEEIKRYLLIEKSDFEEIISKLQNKYSILYTSLSNESKSKPIDNVSKFIYHMVSKTFDYKLNLIIDFSRALLNKSVSDITERELILFMGGSLNKLKDPI